MFVKICGITRPGDAIAAVDAGADAIGLNFVPSSRRRIDLATAREIVAVVRDEIMTVGVFRDHPVDEVLGLTDSLGLRAAQLHGHESPEDIALVAAGVETVIDVIAVERLAQRTIDDGPADIVMLDAASPGSGVPFDWDLVGDFVTKHRVLLAGGLRPDNVAEAIRRVAPWGVDVASGVESVPARKDPAAIGQFVARARAADRER